MAFLQCLSDVFHPDVFFETGTYAGETTACAAHCFKQVHTVELHDALFVNAQAKLAQFENVSVYHGKSSDVISQVGSTLQGIILFWLDAHYSGSGTATSSDNAKDPNAFTAIREELKAIKELSIQNSIILIDDIRLFGTRIGDQDYLGCWAYPTLQEVKRDLLEINPRYAFALVGDILFAYDQDAYNPAFSEAVLACTKTRLYDGLSLSDDELLQLEKIIMYAPAHEKQFMKGVCYMMMDYQDPLFWYDLLRGLVELEAGNYEQAKAAFIKVKKVVHDGAHSFSYDHWRIDSYLQQCNL